jgi:antitoxin MazE
MRARIVRIGNSQGIRIPKPVLEQTQLRDEVEISVKDDQIVLSPISEPRAGWAEAFREMARHRDDEILDAPLRPLTSWDVEEWDW